MGRYAPPRATWALALALACVAACDEEDAAAPEAPADDEQTQKAEAPAQPTGRSLETPAHPGEACARIVLVAYRGAERAPEGVERNKNQALARAEQLLEQAQKAPADFPDLAREHSDAPSSAERGGLIGTFSRKAWPELYASLEKPLFDLKIHEIGGPVEMPYGFAVLKRCPVEKIHARHILIRYEGAERAGQDVTRSKARARQIAEEIHQKVLSEPDRFDELARARSEDGSASRGGDLGAIGRGRLAAPFEKALFALDPGEIGPLVETDYGFHVIQRLERQAE